MSAPTRRRGEPDLSADHLDWLDGGRGGEWGTSWHYFRDGDPPSPAELWASCRDWYVAEHIAEYPGTRPERWWGLDAPEPRRRLGGIGTPTRPRLGGGEPRRYLGVPDEWVTRRMLESYDSFGPPLGVPAIDLADPPRYESEAAYLDRLGLLLPGERRRLTDEDFAPESVLEIFVFDPSEL